VVSFKLEIETMCIVT